MDFFFQVGLIHLLFYAKVDDISLIYVKTLYFLRFENSK